MPYIHGIAYKAAALADYVRHNHMDFREVVSSATTSTSLVPRTGKITVAVADAHPR